eukprot:scaffold4254_cov42-Prasinocladus_malaysianus.AAC.1
MFAWAKARGHDESLKTPIKHPRPLPIYLLAVLAVIVLPTTATTPRSGPYDWSQPRTSVLRAMSLEHYLRVLSTTD